MSTITTLALSAALAASSPAVSERDAGEALASLGVVTHLDYRDTPYANLDRVTAALTHAGVRRVRDMIPDANARPYEQLAASGVRFNLVVRGGKIGDLAASIRKIEALQRRFPGSVSSIEGLNEPNLWPATIRDLTGFAAATAVQRDLFAAVKASPDLRNVPVFALSLGGVGEREFDALGDLSDAADFGNAHVYFGTRPPTATFDFATKLAHRSTPRLSRMVVTETGYASAGKPGAAVNEAVQARYLLTLIAEAWRRDTVATFIYQLVDDKANSDDWSRNLGLYRFDWSAKPAAEALHNLTSAVSEIATARTGAPCKQTVDLPAAPNVYSLTLRAAHGCALLVWLDQPLWNNATNAPLDVSPQAVKVALRPMPATVTLTDPLDGSQRRLASSAAGIDLALGDHPVLLSWH